MSLSTMRYITEARQPPRKYLNKDCASRP